MCKMDFNSTSEIIAGCEENNDKEISQTTIPNTEKDNSKSPTKADIWNYFRKLEGKEKGYAKCNVCKQTISAMGGSTSGLISHAKTRHGINVLKRKIHKENAESTPAKKRISEFFQEKKESLAVVLSRMIALDGLTFSVFATSTDLRRSLKADGHVVPKSRTTIREIVMKFAKKTQEEEKSKIKQMVIEGNRFNVSHDEWTSLKSRRYLNVVLHGKDSQIWNLGLIRMKKSNKAEQIVELIDQRLSRYGLSLNNHIICQMTDGCKTMVKIGKITTTYQQLCLAHGVQLAVLQVLYPKTKKKSKENQESCGEVNDESEEEDTSDSEDEFEKEQENGDTSEENENISDEDISEDDDFFQFALEEEYEERVLSDIYKPIIDKVRKIVKYFTRSSVRNDILQSYVKIDFKDGLELKLDCKTRWNSLLDMLERFYKIIKPLKKALLDFSDGLEIDEQEILIISEIINALTPIKAAVEALCRRDANLLTADTILSFALNKLKQQETDLSEKLFDALAVRIGERRTDLSGVLKYLHTGSLSIRNDSDEELSPEVQEMFDVPSKSKIEKVIIDLVSRLEPEENEKESGDQAIKETSVAENHTKNNKRFRSELHKQLDEAIAKTLAKCVDVEQSQTQSSKSLLKLIKQEMRLLESGGGRGRYLTKAYDYLRGVKPTSIESERAFSSAGYLCPKITCKMNDITLDNLCFLRTYFQSKRDKLLKNNIK